MKVGQNPFHSRNSGLTSYVPIVGSLIGPPGMNSDMLTSRVILTRAGTENDLVIIAERALKQAGWPTDVLTGELAFNVGDNDRNVGFKEVLNDSQLVKAGGSCSQPSL